MELSRHRKIELCTNDDVLCVGAVGTTTRQTDMLSVAGTARIGCQRHSVPFGQLFHVVPLVRSPVIIASSGVAFWIPSFILQDPCLPQLGPAAQKHSSCTTGRIYIYIYSHMDEVESRTDCLSCRDFEIV